MRRGGESFGEAPAVDDHPAEAVEPHERAVVPCLDPSLADDFFFPAPAFDLVKAMDNKYDRSRTRIQVQNRVRNEAAAREMLSNWANALRLALDEARTVVSKQ